MGDRTNDLLLPPGFRFHPKDDEIITSYLVEKVADPTFNAIVMGEADLNRSEPWDLPNLAKYGDDEWYFFSPKVRRYPTGSRTNRATVSGYWKATGKDKEIYKGNNGNGLLVGMKKTLVFYKGRAPKGDKTNWVMHEFRLDGNYRSLNQDWVVVMVKNKKTKKDYSVDASRHATGLSISDYPSTYNEISSYEGGSSSHDPLFDLENIWIY